MVKHIAHQRCRISLAYSSTPQLVPRSGLMCFDRVVGNGEISSWLCMVMGVVVSNGEYGPRCARTLPSVAITLEVQSA